MRALVEQGLRKVIAERKAKAKPYELPDMSFGGDGFQPEFEGISWEKIRDLAYEIR